MGYKQSQYNILIKSTKDKKYLYNTYSGALCVLTENNYKTLKNIENLTNYDDELINNLKEQGFIVDKNMNEYNRILFSQYRQVFNANTQSLSFVIAPTLKCNLKCVYCFESQSCKVDGFSEKTQKEVLEFIKNKIEKNPNLKLVTVDWFGGEPMLKYNEIVSFSSSIINFCKEKNITYRSCMLTNGILLTKEKAISLKEKCNLYSVQIPLDGMPDMYCKLKNTNKDVFDKVINNIIDVCEIMRVQVRLNTNRQNYESIKNLTKYLLIDKNLHNKIKLYIAELKYFDGYTDFDKDSCLENADFVDTKLDFLNFVKNDLKLTDFKFMYDKPKSVTCGLCRADNFVIGPVGELYRCEHHVGHDEDIIGDCVYGRYFTDLDMNFIIPKNKLKCKKCKFYPTCMCGCKSGFLLNGNNKNFCESTKKGLIELLKIKIKDLENNIDTEYGKRR